MHDLLYCQNIDYPIKDVELSLSGGVFVLKEENFRFQ